MIIGSAPDGLPERPDITIARAKIAEYLLNENHRDGGPKARFFLSFGFVPERPGEMEKALADHLLSGSELAREPHPGGYGTTIVVSGTLETPDGRCPTIRSVWIWHDAVVSDGTDGRRVVRRDRVRFITAYPA